MLPIYPPGAVSHPERTQLSRALRSSYRLLREVFVGDPNKGGVALSCETQAQRTVKETTTVFSMFKRICAAFVLIIGLSAPLAADQPPTIVVNITSDDVWSGQMALSFAKTIQSDGAFVVIFLNTRAVALGNTKVPQHTEAVTGKTAHEMLTDIMNAGGRVFICPSCTEQAGLSLDDRIEGSEPGGPALREFIMAPDSKIISF